MTLRPDGLTSTGFYSYGSTWTALSALTEPLLPPTAPSPYRKLYTGSYNANADITFEEPTTPAAAGTAVTAYIECSTVRCLHLEAQDATGTTLAASDPAYGTAGWITLTIPTPLTTSQLAGLRLKVTVRNPDRTASGTASIRAVAATPPTS